MYFTILVLILILGSCLLLQTSFDTCIHAIILSRRASLLSVCCGVYLYMHVMYISWEWFHDYTVPFYHVLTLEERLREAAKQQVRRMCATKKKRAYLNPPEWLVDAFKKNDKTQLAQLLMDCNFCKDGNHYSVWMMLISQFAWALSWRLTVTWRCKYHWVSFKLDHVQPMHACPCMFKFHSPWPAGGVQEPLGSHHQETDVHQGHSGWTMGQRVGDAHWSQVEPEHWKHYAVYTNI